MCFLYRQSISIVYESKFKYIYRYFIKIDRCFCGILQSLPLRKCGLKFVRSSNYGAMIPSLPLRKCGLKLPGDAGILRTGYVTSLAEVWIEIYDTGSNFGSGFVTSLAEVWIEITLSKGGRNDEGSHFPCGSVD